MGRRLVAVCLAASLAGCFEDADPVGSGPDTSSSGGSDSTTTLTSTLDETGSTSLTPGEPVLTLEFMLAGDGVAEANGMPCSNADAPCQFSFPVGTPITLAGIPDVGFGFGGFAEAPCEDDLADVCSFTITESLTVAALFADTFSNVWFLSDDPVSAADLSASNDPDNTICQAQADFEGINQRVIALIASSETPLSDRLRGAQGWVRPDGAPVLTTLSAVEQFETRFPPVLFKNGSTVANSDPRVWTGIGMPGAACSDWTTNAPGATGIIGLADAGGPRMVEAASVACSETAYIYCVGVDFVTALPPPSGEGLLMFISGAPVSPSSGIEALDAACDLEGQLARPRSVFRAAVPMVGESTVQRVFSGAGPWVRPDGLVVLTDPLQNELLAPVLFHADLTPSLVPIVRTGAAGLGAVGNTAENCGDWASVAGDGVVGEPYRAGPRFFNAGGVACTDAIPVYCVEQPG